MKKLALVAAAIAVAIVTPLAAQSYKPKGNLEFIAPAGAGGGWDLTIRTVARVLQDTKLVANPMPVTNKVGGGGAVNLTYMQTQKKNDKLIAVYSPPILLINLNGSTPLSYKDTTPLARLITDYGAFAVNKTSKYKSINEVMDALKKDVTSVTIGGNSAAGSMDHVQFLVMAKAAGITNLKAVKYISFQDNAGAAMLMGDHIDVLSAGLSDLRGLAESGEIKVVASTAAARTSFGLGKIVPTCREAGIPADFLNWRGLFGAPAMSADAQKYWRETLAKMVKTPEWADACEKNGWDQNYADQADFEKFLESNNTLMHSILVEIGIAK
ncbi:MAG TPA: tricarboxylic transport TctC [Treponema sp.]|nr:MAG: tricarboxylic transport TctC [Treponema sp. GWA1_62_8]OHE70235.1 MAG: tricarboxylic transport TctC [Treponema sp. GWC1_61_84]HCM29186.1 tricarboxylic transport TctC [Treponema sp.]